MGENGCMCMYGRAFWSPETITSLLTDYTSTQNIKKKVSGWNPDCLPLFTCSSFCIIWNNLLKRFLNLGGTEPKPRVTCQINRNETKALTSCDIKWGLSLQLNSVHFRQFPSNIKNKHFSTNYTENPHLVFKFCGIINQ